MSNARAIADIVKSGSIVGAGKILQVQYTQFTGTNSIAIPATTDTVLSDLTVNITPISASSIIRIDAMLNGEWSNMSTATDGVWFFYRDTTKLAHASASNRLTGIAMGTPITYTTANADSTGEIIHYSYFDTPSSTSQITYKVGAKINSATTWYINRTVADTDNVGSERGISYISVTEIAG